MVAYLRDSTACSPQYQHHNNAEARFLEELKASPAGHRRAVMPTTELSF